MADLRTLDEPTTHDAQKSLWDVPEPRQGWLRHWDTFIGPGATSQENFLILQGAVFGLLTVIAVEILNENLDWTIWQFLLACILAADIFGGVAANATSAAKRWYHRRSQGKQQHLQFTAIHIVQIALVAAFFMNSDWSWALVVYGYLMLSALAISLAPLHLQRPIALLALVGGILTNIYLLPVVPGLEWFVPVLYLKLLVAHLLRETPYPPPEAT